VLAPNGTALADEFLIDQNTIKNLISLPPRLAALNNGNAFVAWVGTGAAFPDIHGRIIAPNGTALANEFLISQVTAGEENAPSVAALSSGKTFVTWSSSQAGDPHVYGRILSPTGTALTNEFKLNQATTRIQIGSSVAILNNGNAFVAWIGTQGTSGPFDIYGRVFDPYSDPVMTTSQPISPLTALLGIGGAVLGVSLGGSLLSACAIGGLYGFK
jgi:hypothetical protein